MPDMSQFHRGMTTGVVDAAKKAGHDYTKGFNEQAKKAGLPGEQLGKDADKTGRKTGSRMGGAVALGLGAATAGIVAVAAGIGVAVGKAIMGDFTTIHLLVREALKIQAFNQHKDFAQRNLNYVRAELRALQLLRAPARLVVASTSA